MVLAIWVLGMAFGATVAIGGLNALLANRDFAAFWVAGGLARAGTPALAYDLDALRAAASLWLGTTTKIAFPYPPQSLLLAVPLSIIPYKLSFWLWQALSGALFYIAAKPHLPKGFPAILAVLTPAALINVAFGQVGLFYGALWMFAFSGSSLAAAMLTFKPHLGFLVVFEVIRKRHLVSTSVAAIALILLSLLLFGEHTWSASLLGAGARQIEMLTSGAMAKWPTQMVTPLLAYGIFGWALFAIVAAILLSRNFNVFTAATATFLIAPYGFHYDMTVVCLGFGLLLFEQWNGMRVWQRLTCVLAFLSPGLVALGTWLVPVLLLGGLYVQSSLRDEPPESANAGGPRRTAALAGVSD